MPEPIYRVAPVPTMGINKAEEPSKFSDAFSPYMQNVIVEITKVRKRRGYSQLGSASLPLSGTGMELINYRDALGTSHFIAITSTKAYEYQSADGTWAEITPGTEFSGDEGNRFSHCLAVDDTEFANNGGTALIISNGVDDIHYYEGDSADVFTILEHDFPSFGNVKEVEEFWNHFFLINYNDGGNRVRGLAFADSGNLDTWSVGTSGSTTLTDSRGNLLRAVKLGPYMILYSEKSITVCHYYGGDTIFSFPTMVYETGLLAAKAVWGSVNVHLFLGTDQRVYGYFGGTDLDLAGLRIEDSLFAELDVSKKNHVCSGIDIGKHMIHFCYPRASDDYARVSYAIDYKRQGRPWEYHLFANTIRSLAVFENFVSWYCDDTVKKDLYCDEEDFYCDDSYGQTGYPQTAILSHDGYVFKLDEATGKDDAADIEFELWTPEFSVDAEETIGRWLWFSFTAMSAVVGSTVYVYYSTDGGTSWVELTDSPVTLQTSWRTHRLPLTVTDRRIMFRFYQLSSKDIQLRGLFKCLVTPQSERD